MDSGNADAGLVYSTDIGHTVQVPPPQPSVQLWLMLFIPLLIFFLVVLIRAFPWSTAFRTRKPLACDACMSFWCCVLLVPAIMWFFNVPWPWAFVHVWLGGPGAALFLLEGHKRLGLVTKDLTPPGE